MVIIPYHTMQLVSGDSLTHRTPHTNRTSDHSALSRPILILVASLTCDSQLMDKLENSFAVVAAATEGAPKQLSSARLKGWRQENSLLKHSVEIRRTEGVYVFNL